MDKEHSTEDRSTDDRPAAGAQDLRIPIDLPVAGLVLVLVGYILINSQGFPDVAWSQGGRPAFYPRILAALLAVFAVILAVKGRTAPTIAVFPRPRRLLFMLSCAGGCIVLPLVVMPLLGFRISAFLFMFPVMIAGRGHPRTRRDVLVSAGAALLITAIIYGAFVYLARVRLPVGSITRW